jgi:hypothetical protein
MVDRFKKFTRGFTVFSVSVLLISLAIYLWLPKVNITPVYPYIVLFFYGITIIIFRILDKTKQEKISRFTNTYMLVNFGKLILFSVLVFVYAFLNRSDAVPFIITFFVYYLLFSFYEIFSLLKK